MRFRDFSIFFSVPILLLLVMAIPASAEVKLGDWQRIGPFRDQGPLLNWMNNVIEGFAHEYDVEKDALANGGEANLGKKYPAPNFPATPKAVRTWTKHPDWIDGYYQELPRGPAPSAGESQFVYRTITVDEPTELEIDFILRAPEADRRMGGKGMEDFRRKGRYWWSLDGKKIATWEGRDPMPHASAGKVTLAIKPGEFRGALMNFRLLRLTPRK